VGEKLSIDFGSHVLKVGGEALNRTNHVNSQAFIPGRFNFGSLSGNVINSALATTTITALQAFNLGLPQSYQQGFGDPTVFSTDPYWGLYAQDHWRITNRST